MALGLNVALLVETTGVTPDDVDIVLPRGQVGIVVETKDPEVWVVEFAEGGVVHAIASVQKTNLLVLHDRGS